MEVNSEEFRTTRDPPDSCINKFSASLPELGGSLSFSIISSARNIGCMGIGEVQQRGLGEEILHKSNYKIIVEYLANC